MATEQVVGNKIESIIRIPTEQNKSGDKYPQRTIFQKRSLQFFTLHWSLCSFI